MSIKTLNERLNILDAIRHFDKNVHLIPIDLNLIRLAQISRRKYEQYLEEQKAEKNKIQTEEKTTREMENIEKENKEKNKKRKDVFKRKLQMQKMI